MSTPIVVFISGHLDLTRDEFDAHYRPALDRYMALPDTVDFVVGDARGCDQMAQEYLAHHAPAPPVTVFHMFVAPRHNAGTFAISGGFTSDGERDAAMTAASSVDLAWVRPGREKSGTAKNLARRGSTS
jgi:hypothetical protein